jgi:drug/metabolite transporter (DMT)-like permease
MSAPTRRVAVVVWAGMVSTPVLFAAAAFTAAPPREMRSPELAGMFFWMAAAVVGLGIALSRLLPSRIRQRGPGPRDAVAFTRLVVGWAILEGAAIFPLVAQLVTGDPFLYLLFAVALAALVGLFPSEARWASHAVQPIETGGPDRMVR